MKLRKLLAVVLLAAVIAPTAIIPVSAAGDGTLTFHSVIEENVDYDGDVTLGAIDLAGKTVVINGNVTQTGDVKLSGGTLIVTGDYTVEGGTLEADNGSVTVNGNMTISGGAVTVTKPEASDGGSITVEGNTHLVNGSINVDGGVLNISGSFTQESNVNCKSGEVHVGGSWLQKKNTLSIIDANVILDGDYTLAVPSFNGDGELTGYSYASGCIQMTGDKGHFRISGDTVIKSSWSSSSNQLKAGLLELGGNFYQYIGNGTSDNFSCKDSHMVKLIGEDSQIINFEAPRYSGFNILLPSNNPKADITSASIKRTEGESVIGSFVQYGSLEFAGSSLTVTGDLVQNGTITGGAQEDPGILNVRGDMIQKGGILDVKGADIHINGSYFIADPIRNDQGVITDYNYVDAALKMENENGTLTVDKDMVTKSSYSASSNILTAGTLILCGSFTQLAGNNTSDNFDAKGNHKIRFSGTGKQIMNFQSTLNSGFNILTDTSNNAADITSGAIAKLDNDCIIGSFDQYRELDLNGHTLVVDGNMVQHGNIRLNGGKLVVTGDYRQEGGTLYIQDGRLEINGDYRLQALTPDGSYTYAAAGIRMDNEKGRMIVNGDFVTQSSWSSSANILTAGTLELKGNFTQLIGNGTVDNFLCKENHKVLFTGSGKQVVSFEDPANSGFNTLLASNNPKLDIKAGSFTRLEGNSTIGSFTQYRDLYLDGASLTVTGNMTQWGYIRAGGGILNVNGNYLQSANTLYIQDGIVNISGDYRIQRLYADGIYSYASAALNMDDPAGHLKVAGNMITQAAWNSSSNVLTAGTLELKGDFTQLIGNGTVDNFLCKENHKVLFTGSGKQVVSFEDPAYSGFNILLASNNPKLDIKAGSFTKLEGNSTIGSFTQYRDLYLDGASLTVTGDMTQWGYIRAGGGILNVNGNYLQSANTLYIQDGIVNISGDYRIQRLYADDTYSYASAALNMDDPAGHLKVAGNMITQAAWNSSSNVLTAGTLELKGDFTQLIGNGSGDNFLCKENHKVLFTGSGKQIVSFEDPANSGFNILLASDNPGVDVIAGSFTRLEGNSTIGSFTQYRDLYLEGGRLTVTGDMTQWGYIRAGEGVLNVKGNYLQSANTLYIQNGNVHISGDYRIQRLYADGTYSYASAALNMEDKDGYIFVGGQFITQSAWNESSNVLIAGIFELQGDLTQKTGNGTISNFVCKSNHKFVLSGNKDQNIKITNYKKCKFAELYINKPVGLVHFINPVSYSKFQICLLNNSVISAEQVKVGQRVFIGYAAEGGTEPYTFACFYKRSSNTKWNALAGDTPSFVPAAATDYDVKTVVVDSAGLITEKNFKVTALPSDMLENTSSLSSENVSVGQAVKVIGSAEGGKSPYTFEYYFKRSTNSKWNSLKASNPTFTPTAAADYDIKVVVTDAQGTQAVKLMTVKVNEALVNTSTISSERVKTGQAVRVTGSAEGGSSPYTFEYYFKRSTNSKWNTLKVSNPTFTPTAAADYDVKAVAIDSEGGRAEKLFKVTAVSSDTLENTSSLSADKVSVGQTVKVIGSAEGGNSPYTFEYYFKRSTNSKWNTLKASNPTFTPTAAADYDVKVVVKDAQGEQAVKLMTIKVSEALVNTSTISSESVTAGQTVKITGSAEGGYSPYTFEYYFKRSANSKWNSLKVSSPSFTPTAAADYDVKVVAKDSSGAQAVKTFTVKVS